MVTLHEDLETQIDVEQRCREKAEEYASKVRFHSPGTCQPDNSHLSPVV